MRPAVNPATVTLSELEGVAGGLTESQLLDVVSVNTDPAVIERAEAELDSRYPLRRH